MPLNFKKKTNIDSDSEGNGVAVEDSNDHGVVEEGSLEVPSRFKKKMISECSFEGKGCGRKGSETPRRYR